MRFVLHTINTMYKELQVDLEFTSIEEVEQYLNRHGYTWTSLVISVLPR